MPLTRGQDSLQHTDVNIELNEFTRSRLIHVVVEKGDLNAVNDILSRSPELDAYDATGHTPLAIAARMGRNDIAEALLNAGANVNAEGVIDNKLLPKITGMTALHVAALKGNIPMMELLLSRGANIYAVKNQTENQMASSQIIGHGLFKSYNIAISETALDLVRRQGLSEAEAFLNKKIADDTVGQHHSCCSMM